MTCQRLDRPPRALTTDGGESGTGEGRTQGPRGSRGNATLLKPWPQLRATTVCHCKPLAWCYGCNRKQTW